MKANFNTRFKQILEQSIYTRTEAAQVFGVTKETIMMWEHGHMTVKPDDRLALRIAKFFNISLRDLFADSSLSDEIVTVDMVITTQPTEPTLKEIVDGIVKYHEAIVGMKGVILGKFGSRHINDDVKELTIKVPQSVMEAKLMLTVATEYLKNIED